MALPNPLRPITQRLNSTPVEELPRYAGFLATTLRNCTEFLRGPESQKHEASVQIHKLSTRLSALLQDKTQEGRFTGIILAKALLEATGPQTLTASGLTWTRSLISCLNKPDPPQVKKLSVITTTRIFLLTVGDQAMVREITTPSLPPFVTACLNAIKPFFATKDGIEKQVPSSLLPTVLQCWVELIQNFPSTFRPFIPSIRAIVLSILSQDITSQEVKGIAFQLFAILHFCAPKDKAVSEWSQSTTLIIEAIHQTADVVFRSIVEDWTGTTPRQILKITSKQAASVPKAAGVDAIGMDKWNGLHAGLARTIDLVHLLSAMLTSDHAQAVRIPLAEVLDLTGRLAAALPPSPNYSLRDNKEIGREERDELYAGLPRLHCAILMLYEKMVQVYGQAMVQISKSCLSQIWDIFESESFNVEIRKVVYNSIKSLLQHKAILLSASDSSHIASLIRSCCNDLISELGGESDTLKAAQNGALKLDHAVVPKRKLITHQPESILAKAAWDLLPVVLVSVPPSLITSISRTEMDRTAILLNHKEALLASVMNPPALRRGTQHSVSVLPFLTRADGNGLALEALMRPRQPTIRTGDQIITEVDGEQNENQPENEDMMIDEEPHNVLDDAGGHVEEDSSKDLVSEEAQAKKRDHAAVDDTPKLPVAESSKRPKTGSPAPESDRHSEPTTEVQLSHNKDTLELTPVVSNTHALFESNPVQSKIKHNKAPEPAVELSQVQSSSRYQKLQDDDSDDSEIPQIDAALSSDEDEDEDEFES